MMDWTFLEFPDTKEAYSVPARVRDFINAILASRSWQPIETAPKDGTKILVAVPDINAPVSADWRIASNGNGGWGCDEIIWWVEPTHWMPLPELPYPPRETDNPEP